MTDILRDAPTVTTQAATRRRAHDDLDPMPRCCEQHTDWAQLAQHLLDEFPDATIRNVVRELRTAKSAVEGIELSEADALAVGELIARHQLMLLTGRVGDAARLDPERHVRVI